MIYALMTTGAFFALKLTYFPDVPYWIVTLPLWLMAGAFVVMGWLIGGLERE